MINYPMPLYYSSTSFYHPSPSLCSLITFLAGHSLVSALQPPLLLLLGLNVLSDTRPWFRCRHPNTWMNPLPSERRASLRFGCFLTLPLNHCFPFEGFLLFSTCWARFRFLTCSIPLWAPRFAVPEISISTIAVIACLSELFVGKINSAVSPRSLSPFESSSTPIPVSTSGFWPPLYPSFVS